MILFMLLLIGALLGAMHAAVQLALHGGVHTVLVHGNWYNSHSAEGRGIHRSRGTLLSFVARISTSITILLPVQLFEVTMRLSFMVRIMSGNMWNTPSR